MAEVLLYRRDHFVWIDVMHEVIDGSLDIR